MLTSTNAKTAISKNQVYSSAICIRIF